MEKRHLDTPSTAIIYIFLFCNSFFFLGVCMCNVCVCIARYKEVFCPRLSASNDRSIFPRVIARQTRAHTHPHATIEVLSPRLSRLISPRTNDERGARERERDIYILLYGEANVLSSLSPFFPFAIVGRISAKKIRQR